VSLPGVEHKPYYSRNNRSEAVTTTVEPSYFKDSITRFN